MATRYAAIDLSLLAAPKAIEEIDFEEILEAHKQLFIQAWNKFRERYPELPDYDGLVVQSDVLAFALLVGATREMVVRQVGNDKYKASTLAYATETDLDAKVAEVGVKRKMIDVGDPNATPEPIPPKFESDDDLRARAQIAWEAQSTAGPTGGYEFHALSADGKVRAAAVFGPESTYVDPGEVLVTILSHEGTGEPTPELLTTVNQHLSARDRRPLTDRVFVEGADIHEYAVVAKIFVPPGASAEVVRQAAVAAVQAYTDQQHRIGENVRLTRLAAALYVGDDSGRSPVTNVEITSPVADIVTDPRSAPRCTSITITAEVV